MSRVHHRPIPRTQIARAWLAAIAAQARTGNEIEHTELGRVIDALGRIVCLARTPLPANAGEVQR